MRCSVAAVLVWGLVVGCGGVGQEAAEPLGSVRSKVLGTPGLRYKGASYISMTRNRNGAVESRVASNAQFYKSNEGDLRPQEVRALLESGDTTGLLLRVNLPTNSCLAFEQLGSYYASPYENADIGPSFKMVSTQSPDASFTLTRRDEGIFQYLDSQQPAINQVTAGSAWRVEIAAGPSDINTSKINGSLLIMPDYVRIAALEQNNYTLLINPSQPLDVEWTGATGATGVRFQFVGFTDAGAVGFICAVDNTGHFTIPQASLAGMPPSGLLIIAAERVEEIPNASNAGRPHTNLGGAVQVGSYQFVQ